MREDRCEELDHVDEVEQAAGGLPADPFSSGEGGGRADVECMDTDVDEDVEG